MPKVNIRELDLTGSAGTTYVENIALIPGVKIAVYDPDTEEICVDAEGKELTLDGTYLTLADFEDQVEKIFKKLASFGENYGQVNELLKAIEPYFIQDKGYATAYLTLNGGLPIEYGGLYTLQVIEPEESGEAVIIKPNFVAKEITDFYEKYSDRGLYDVKFITIPTLDDVEGVNEQETLALITAITNGALHCAGDRGDAYALISLPSNLTSSTDINTWVINNLATTAAGYISRTAPTWGQSATEQYGAYGAVFTPNFITNFTIVSPVTIDNKTVSYQFKNVAFQAAIDYLLCYAKTIVGNPTWYAISGSIRGVTPLAKFVPLNKYGDADVDAFQPRDVQGHISVNAICNIRPYGNIIWGNRTMHPLNVPANGSSDAVQLVASDFLNIRSLCCDIKKTLYRAARRYSFDPNSDALWFNFKSLITPLLEKMKSFDGIRDYQIIKVPTKKKALLAARIIISPIEAVEDFDLTVELTDAIEVVEN